MMLNLKQDFREVLLRSFFALLFTCLILGLSVEKISIAFKFKSVEPIITMQIKQLTGFPVWSSFICAPQLARIDVETLKRGVKPNGQDKATKITTGNYVRATNTDSLTAGDWTNERGAWPCFVFEPRNEISFKIGEIDQIILTAFVNEGAQVLDSPNGLLFGIFDVERNLSTVQPFAGPIPSINTFTFTRSERTDVKNETHSYFSVNQQNLVKQEGGFAVRNLAARFLYSPDSYLVMSYKEKMPYTPYDLISAVGGLITYALAVWFILFGRGKYRSWGLVQRYLLRTSPDANKDDDNRLLSIPYGKTNDIESQMNNNNNNTLVGTSVPAIEKPTSDHTISSPAYYFSTSGTPTQANFASSPLPNVITSPSQPQLVKDLNKRIDAKINQKLWFVEQTLSRHYLSGFRLRRYDFDPKKLGLEPSYEEEEEGMLTPPNAHHNWNNFDSGTRTPDQNDLRNFQISSSTFPPFQNDNLNNDSLNPEAKRHQYPNVAIGQVPIEKKQRGRNSNGIVPSVHDGNYLSNPSSSSSSSSSSSYPNHTNYPQISQSDTNTKVILS